MAVICFAWKHWCRMIKRRNLEPKKWSLFDIVGIYSTGVKMTLKVWFTPMETTSEVRFWNVYRFGKVIFKIPTLKQCLCFSFFKRKITDIGDPRWPSGLELQCHGQEKSAGNLGWHEQEHECPQVCFPCCWIRPSSCCSLLVISKKWSKRKQTVDCMFQVISGDSWFVIQRDNTSNKIN